MTDSDSDSFSVIPPWKKLPLNPTAADQSSNSPAQFSILLINLALKVAMTNN